MTLVCVMTHMNKSRNRGVLQCAAAWCSFSELQCVVVCSSVLQCVAAYCGSAARSRTCGVLQCVAENAVFCSVFQCVVQQCVTVCCSVLQQCGDVRRDVLRCVATCCGVMQCVAVCCGVLQCVAVCCGVLQCVRLYTTTLPLRFAVLALDKHTHPRAHKHTHTHIHIYTERERERKKERGGCARVCVCEGASEIKIT